MYERFTDRARKVMQLANQEAQRFNHEYIGTEHILLGLVAEGGGGATDVLKNLNVDLRKVCTEVDKIVQAGPDAVTMGKLPMTPRAKKVIEYAIEEARHLDLPYVDTEHLLLGVLREQEGVAAQVLMNLGLTLLDVRENVFNLLGEGGTDAGTAEKRISKTPALDRFGRDLTELARQGKLDPLIGRKVQLQALAEVLGCHRQNNAVLLGETGVGKHAIVAGLAQAIAARAAPDWLEGMRIVELSFSRVYVGLRPDEPALDRMRALLGEARRSPKLILFLPDELRSLATAHGSPALHAEWLDALERAELCCILAGTPADYQRCLNQAVPLDRWCQPVRVPPATLEETRAIVGAVREQYEKHHQVRFTQEALTAVAELADRHLPGVLPAMALLLLDHAGARGRGKGADASREVREANARLTEEIDRLNEDKETAVAQQAFDRAAELRDRADRLKKQREALLDQEKHLRQVNGGTIEAADVADTLAQLTGNQLPLDGLSFVTGIKRPRE